MTALEFEFRRGCFKMQFCKCRLKGGEASYLSKLTSNLRVSIGVCGSE